MVLGNHSRVPKNLQQLIKTASWQAHSTSKATSSPKLPADQMLWLLRYYFPYRVIYLYLTPLLSKTLFLFSKIEIMTENLPRRNLEAKLDSQYLNGKVTFHIPRMHRRQNLSWPPLSHILQGIYSVWINFSLQRSKTLCSTEGSCTVSTESPAKLTSRSGHGSPLDQIRLYIQKETLVGSALETALWKSLRMGAWGCKVGSLVEIQALPWVPSWSPHYSLLSQSQRHCLKKENNERW